MRVLVVEDETALAEAICAILRREGYAADMANDGKTGLDKAMSGKFDCMILDIMLPVMNGLDVLSYLRVMQNEIPVLLLTARSEIDDRIKGLDCGADDYLTKPFATGELLARVRAMTRRLGIAPDINPKFGDITLDLKKGEANNNIEVYISFLRKKLQMLHSHVQIKTRRGIGYCLEVTQ